MEKIYPSEQNALLVNISGLKPKVKLNDYSMNLREEKNNLQKLFKSSIDFYKYMSETDYAQKRIKVPNVSDNYE